MFERDHFFTVKAGEVDEYRVHIEGLLKAFEGRNDKVTAQDVLWQAASGLAQLWAYAQDGEVKAVAATRIREMARGRLCTIWIAVGFDHLNIFEGAHAEIEAWALEIGCYAVEIIGREGWQRVLPGYVRTAVVLEKQIQKVH